MSRAIFITSLFCLMISIEGSSQSSTKSFSTTSYHHPSADNQSWQRLLLQLSSNYFLVVNEGQIDMDSSLVYVSRSLGLSRISILGEGINDPELLAHSQWIDQKNPKAAIHLLSQATGKKHLELLILLGAYYAFQPGDKNYYRDSVAYFLNKAIIDSKVTKEERLGRQALCLLVKMYDQVNNTQHGDSLFNQLIKECDVTDDRETQAKAFVYRAIYIPLSPISALTKIVYLQKAADLYHLLKNTEGEINALTDIGYLFVLTFQLNKAYDMFSNALQKEEAIHYPYTQYNTEALALVTMFEGKFGEPLKYALQSIRASEVSRDSIGWAYFYSRLADLYYLEGGREKERMDCMRKALERFVFDRNPMVHFLLTGMVAALTAENRSKEALNLVLNLSDTIPPVTFPEQYAYHMALAMCYNNLHQLELAKTHLLKADSMETKTESVRGPLRRAIINNEYGFVYFDAGQFAKSKSYFEKYLSATTTNGRTLILDLDAYRKLISIDSILNDPLAGLAHQKKYIQLLDSNFRASKIRQAEELQVMYQTEEKENQIAFLNQRAKLEQADLEQATLIRNMTIAGIIGMLVIAGLLYRQNRLRKQNNRVISKKNEQLQTVLNEKERLLDEKEWLIKETHHRVKNNLQIVMSLLNSQSVYIDNEAALTAIHDSQHRVHAMSLIHQKLYNTENISCIDMSVYIRELASYLADSFNTGQRIHFQFALEQLEMDVSMAVPLGLILNEAITNSIKYAFPNGANGVISISLSTTTPEHYLLCVSDNGIGISTQFDNKKPGSLGMSLMAGLSKELGGNFSMEKNNGTVITISFMHDSGVKRPDKLDALFVSNN